MDFPLDPQEALRLKAIQGLGVEAWLPAGTLDRLTAHARAHFHVPICLVTLVEADCALLISRQGIEGAEVPRQVAFCSHTIVTPALLVVPDTRADPRFRDNPLVTGAPHIRFYAGAPLAYEGDVRLGSLCIMDHKPRTLTRGEQAELAMFADYVSSVITSRALGLPEPDIGPALQ